MKRVLVLLFLALLPAVVPAAQLVDVRIYDRTAGRELPVYASGGRLYVAGTPGNEYAIQLRNRSGDDALAVVSVDGVNAVTGETAAVGQGGYIIRAGQCFDVKGWRKSLEQVAAFYFSRQQDSYAARTGRPDEVGVIGVAVFRRKPEPPALESPRSRLDSPADAARARREGAGEPSRQSSADESVLGAPARLGTGHGGSESSVARYAQFERATTSPEQLIAIQYDTRDNLIARGIIPARQREPQPFPAHFVSDPPRR